MKKLILCILAAILMLSFLVTAPQVGPPTCAYVGGICEADGELSGVCNDANMMVYGETSDCYNPARLCCVPETCRDVGGWCDISCGPDNTRVAEGKCGEEDVCCRESWISGPDADGNVVCKGASMQTKYTLEALKQLKELLGVRSAYCVRTGELMMITEGAVETDWSGSVFGPYMYGTVTVDSNRNIVKIENGGLLSQGGSEEDFFGEYFRNKPTGFSITANTITINFADKAKPRISVSSDGAIKWGDVFFGCLKKDSNGRALSCSLSAGMAYLGTEDEGYYMLSLDYANIEGHGFVSELAGLQTYINRKPETIEKLKEQTGRDFVAVPLTNLKSIRLFKPSSESRNYPYTISVKTNPDGSSSFNYLKIKSSTGNDVNIDAIGNSRGMQPITKEIEIAPWHPLRAETLDVTADAARVSREKQDAFSVNAQCADASGTSRAKVNVFIGNNKLVEATECNHVIIIPPQPAGTGIAIADTNDFSILRLNSGTKEIRVTRDIKDYGDLSIWMLSGYENFALVNPAGTGSICSAIPTAYKITNPRNNNALELGDTLLEITPEGKLIPDLGFSFTAELCNDDTELMETLVCKKIGECTLDGDPVFGVTAAPMQDVRGAQRTGRRFEEGAKGIGEGSEETLGQKCDTDEDCGATEYCNLVGRERVCVLQEQGEQGAKSAGEILGYEYDSCSSNNDCQRGLTCSNRLCRATCAERNGFSADEGCFIDTFLNSACVTQSNGIRLCEVECETDDNCARMPVPSVCTDGECLPASKSIFARGWNWLKGLFS